MPTTVVAVFTKAPMVVSRPALVKIIPARKNLKISLGDFTTMMTCLNFSTNLLFKYALTVARKTTNANTIM